MAPTTLPRVSRNSRRHLISVLPSLVVLVLLGYMVASQAEGLSRLLGWAMMLLAGLVAAWGLREFFSESRSVAPLTLPQLYRNSRGHLISVLPSLFVLVLLGYALAFGTESGFSRLLGGGMLLLSGLVFVWGLREFFDTSPRLTLNRTGVTDRRLPVGEIAWTDITGAFLRARLGNYYIHLELRNPEDYLTRLPPLRRRASEANLKLGNPPVFLSLSLMKADPAAVLATVRQLAGLLPQ